MQTHAKLVTIVTISKDDPSGLAATLASTASLRADARVEHIVVARGTSLEVAMPGGILLLRQEKVGIAVAFNEGLAAATGEWVWFLNGGDRLSAEVDVSWLMRTLEVTRASLVAGTLRKDADGTERLHPAEWTRWPMSSCWLSHPSTLVRTRCIREVGCFDPSFRVAMDYDLWQRLFAQGVSANFLDVPLVEFADGGLSSSRAQLATMVAEDFRIHRRHALTWFGRWARSGGLYGIRLLVAPLRLLRIRLGLVK